MVEEILTYFVRNPLAADSLEGIARWRLMDEVIRRNLNRTEASLRWLVAQGYLTSSVAPGGAATFSLNHDRLDEAKRFLTDVAPADWQRGVQ